jgi:hypothetical protein
MPPAYYPYGFIIAAIIGYAPWQDYQGAIIGYG